MKDKQFSRRDILKLSGLSLSSLALKYFLSEDIDKFLPSESVRLVRVTVEEIRVFEEPSYQSDVVSTRKRDELIYVYEKLNSPMGPDFNPRWYLIDGGYVHTAYLQPVETHLNEVIYQIPDTGQLAEVTVPISLSFRYTDYNGWEPLYRLYYKSMHWVTGIGYGPNYQAWYKIEYEIMKKIKYLIPAHHMRFIDPEEITPLSTNVPPEEKKVVVDRQAQTLTAYEGTEEVFHTNVSTGMEHRPVVNAPSLITPLGKFNIQMKRPVRHMGEGRLTNDINAYELPGIPWVAYFYQTGVAFHGTYWHDNYGNEMSHGCVNMRPDEAKWLWRWLTPESNHIDRVVYGKGTSVEVV